MMPKNTHFRAKVIDRDKWVYGDYFSQCKDGTTTHFIVTHPNGRNNAREVMWTIDPETVGQYTGKEAGDGVPVYTGDVLSDGSDFGDRQELLLVAYDVGDAQFTAKNKTRSVASRYWGNCKVIGNIAEDFGHDTVATFGGHQVALLL